MPEAKPPKDQRIPIMMSEAEVKAVDDWSFEHRIRSRSEAVRRLIQIALLLDQDFEQFYLATQTMHAAVNNAVEAFIELRDGPGVPQTPEFDKLWVKLGVAFEDTYQATLIYNSIIETAGPFRDKETMSEALQTAARARAESVTLREEFSKRDPTFTDYDEPEPDKG